MDLVIVTGMSGAGKSTAMIALEDMGYFCVDNVPTQMIGKFVELHKGAQEYGQKMALGVDSRSFKNDEGFVESLQQLDQDKVVYKLLFLDASDTVIFNRYKENRRNHPLLKGELQSLKEAIVQERVLMEPIKNLTEYLIDTTHSSIKELKHQVITIVNQEDSEEMLVQVMSFGFKYGLPMEPDLVFDVRCLPNPFYDPQLREKTGLDQEVKDFVMKSVVSRELLDKLIDLFEFTIPLYKTEGKTRLVIAIGCTGGKHRSVTFAEEIYRYLKDNKINAIITHRDYKTL